MNDLTVYRLKKTEETLNESRILLEARLFKGSVSRSYYSIFSSVRAFLAERGVDFSKHAGVISYFRRNT